MNPEREVTEKQFSVQHKRKLSNHVVGGRMTVLKDVHGLLPGTCIRVTLHSKKDSADAIKDSEMGRLAWIILVDPTQTQGSL